MSNSQICQMWYVCMYTHVQLAKTAQVFEGTVGSRIMETCFNSRPLGLGLNCGSLPSCVGHASGWFVKCIGHGNIIKKR